MNDSTILVVEDDRHLKDALVGTLETAGYSVLAASDGGEALDVIDGAHVDLVVTDVQMTPIDGRALLRSLKTRHPRLPVLVMTAFGTIEQAVGAMQDGAIDYLVKPFEAQELERRVSRCLQQRPNALEPPALEPSAVEASALKSSALEPPAQEQRASPEPPAPEQPASQRASSARATCAAQASGASDGRSPIAIDPRSTALLDLARKVAASDVTVLLTGESGTGKEVLARYIHAQSPRGMKPFIAVNCAAIPAAMLEALLFGHEKGAFTGAQGRSDGKFVQANGGTLLLDEITEMELGLQAKLLRVLQEREVEPLGARKPIPLDVRVIATSNRDLDEAVGEGSFREDLYYRLSVFPLEIPPLRERRADVAALAERFVARHAAGRAAPRLSEAAVDALKRHSWPGNVRELENVIQRALVLCGQDPCIEPGHLVLDAGSRDAGTGLSAELWEEEARRIVGALKDAAGSRKQAAERLGISDRTLRYKLAKMRAAGISVPSGRGTSPA